MQLNLRYCRIANGQVVSKLILKFHISLIWYPFFVIIDNISSGIDGQKFISKVFQMLVQEEKGASC